jgi:ubiquinone/menaquinone biosynthesis C-methylase UbiE
MQTFSEAEIQLLIVFIELQQPKETPNNTHYTFYPKSIEKAATYFLQSRQDWTNAYSSLLSRGYLQQSPNGYVLTASGAASACRLRDERPPIYYWYIEFYTRAAHSPAYARFCEKVYGKNLCQAGFSDLEQINKLVEVTGMNANTCLLDLGCGNGMVAEYLSDVTGAQAWGLDYSPIAIEQAQQRTTHKRSHLNFKTGNLDLLDFPDASFDLILSIDSLYMPNDLQKTLKKMVALLKPGGQIAVFYINMINSTKQDRQSLRPRGTPLGVLLGKLQLPYQVWDFTRQTYQMLQRKYQVGKAMQAEFESEGSRMLSDFILAESEQNRKVYNPDTCLFSRYLYLVTP